MHWITRIILTTFAMLLLILWLLPATQRTATLTWGGILLVTSCILYLAVAFRRLLGTWRGLGAVAAMLFLALVWLRWQWPLRWSGMPLLQNLNFLISLLAWGLFIGLYASSLFLLIYRDASVVFIAMAWMIYLLLMLAITAQYERLGDLQAALLAEQLLWGAPLLWSVGMACLAPLAFLGHLVILLVKEVKGLNAQ